jgi:hypothetical protein
MTSVARHCGLVVVIAVLCLQAMGRADAGSVTYTVPLDSKTQPGFLPQFDPALGTLTELDISATGGAGGTFDAIPDVSTVAFSQTVMFAFTSAEPPFLIGLGEVVTTSSVSFPTPTGVLDLGSGFTFNTTITSGLNSFLGTDLFNMQVGAQIAVTSTAPPAQVDERLGTSFAVGTATVTYVYVPEPSSAVIAGTASGVILCYWLCGRMRAAT